MELMAEEVDFVSITMSVWMSVSTEPGWAKAREWGA